MTHVHRGERRENSGTPGPRSSIVDWLGATKPLLLIGGACAIIALISAIAQLF